jgi:hypothetical protein
MSKRHRYCPSCSWVYQEATADQAAIDALKAKNIAAAVADNERARARGAETTTANEMFGQRVWDAAWAQSVEARLAKHGQRLDALEKPSGDAERIKDVAEQPNG